MSNFRTKLDPDKPSIIESTDSIQNEDPKFKPYFSIHFDNNGKIIGVDVPKQVKIQWVDDSSPPLMNVIAVSAVKIIHKSNSSPSCIMHKGRLICWG